MATLTLAAVSRRRPDHHPRRLSRRGQEACRRPLQIRAAWIQGACSRTRNLWVVLGNSDIVPADMAAAAAAAGHGRLNFSPLPMNYVFNFPSPCFSFRMQMVLGGVGLPRPVPFYKRARKMEGETLENVETAVGVVEHVAEVTEKLSCQCSQFPARKRISA
ncbi:hypothetical protein HU200_002469 [Digitaria exilis]|uniref:Uncharacterized protein n=1 Tax=Digitaria exilis TaxID=1010633 RepID=A0A835KV40_9POAL|nr:hypothetical protein HU200_002469 [Digitaria exilis]